MKAFKDFLPAYFATAVLLAPTATLAEGAGNGFFFEGSGGSGDFEFDEGGEYDFDTQLGSLGYVFDSAPTGNQPFNYRLNVGVGQQKLDFDAGGEIDAAGIHVDNTFGFRFIARNNVRWWGGPSVRVGYYYSNDGYEPEYADFALGFKTGVNFDLGGVTLSPSVAWRAHGAAGSDNRSYDNDFTASYGTVTFNGALLF